VRAPPGEALASRQHRLWPQEARARDTNSKYCATKSCAVISHTSQYKHEQCEDIFTVTVFCFLSLLSLFCKKMDVLYRTASSANTAKPKRIRNAHTNVFVSDHLKVGGEWEITLIQILLKRAMRVRVTEDHGEMCWALRYDSGHLFTVMVVYMGTDFRF
jgi:hypothetical protein